MDRDRTPQESEDTHAWLRLVGALMLTFGVLATIAPSVAAVAAELAAGWLLLLGGLFGLGLSMLGPPFGTRAWWWNLGASTFAAFTGTLLLWYPALGLTSATLLLAGYLAASGLAKLAIPILYRSGAGALAPWIAAAGLLDIALAWFALWQWSLLSPWLPGLLVGASLITSGTLLLNAAYPRHAHDKAYPKATAH